MYVASRCGFAYNAAYEHLDEHESDEDIKKSFFTKAHTVLINMAEHIEQSMPDDTFYFTQSIENEIESIAAYYRKIAPKSYIGNNQFMASWVRI